jgi:leucine dehydrogenase
MTLFEQVAKMGHERVVICSNPEVGLRAIVAVHSTVLGPGLGGVRMWNYASD